MANMFDYLDWRGDIPMFVDGFNEVDNLILSEIAYVDFEGVLPERAAGPQSVELTQASERYFQLHTEKEIRSRTTFTKQAPFLFRKAAQTRRFSKARIGRYINRFSRELDEQMAAMTFYLEDGTTYVAFRGTDNTMVGWKEDLMLSFREETAGQRHAVQYLSELQEVSDIPAARLITGGHSKGGNLAVYASAFCREAVRNRITQIYSNDGPGFLETVTSREEYQRVIPLVRSIIPEGSFFGLLLDSGYTHRIIKSSQTGIFQHDALSWQVCGPRLVEAGETTQISAFMEKTMNHWLEGINLQERRAFVDALFEMLSSTGAQTLGGLKEVTPAGWLDMLKSFGTMEGEDQKIFGNTILNLLRSGINTLSQEVSERSPRQQPPQLQQGRKKDAEKEEDTGDNRKQKETEGSD